MGPGGPMPETYSQGQQFLQQNRHPPVTEEAGGGTTVQTQHNRQRLPRN